MSNQIVKLEPSRDQKSLMAIINGKVSFPDRRNTLTAKAGENWEVEVVGTNPTGKVQFFMLIKKIELHNWSWSDKQGNRDRQPACLIITPKGEVFRFKGNDIEGVVRVTNRDCTKAGKWSHTTYSCISAEGTKIYAWYQSWEEGVFWPQASWEEAFEAVKKEAPQAHSMKIEEVIRFEWDQAAAKFDQNRAAFQAFAQAETKPYEWQWNDQQGSRDRQAACIIITPKGEVFRFKGSDIEGVVRVTKRDSHKAGKWSHTIYSCVSPEGTLIREWHQSWDQGVFWPDDSWNRALKRVRLIAPHTSKESLVTLIRTEWNQAAEKFDKFRGMEIPDEIPSQEVLNAAAASRRSRMMDLDEE